MRDVIRPYVWHDPIICDITLSYACLDAFERDMTHSYVWHDSCPCDVTDSYVGHDPFICAMANSYVWHHIFVRDMTCHQNETSHSCDVTHLYIFVQKISDVTSHLTHSYAWHIYMFSMTHSYVPWRIHMCDITYLYVIWPIHMRHY